MSLPVIVLSLLLPRTPRADFPGKLFRAARGVILPLSGSFPVSAAM